jgi:hypothetical protein
MFRAYLDETGQESKDWVFLAGFLGKKDQWEAFTDAWKEGLGPQRKSLHMTDLRFKKEREKRLLERLAPIPLSCGLEPVLGGIKVSDDEDLFHGDSFQEKLNNGYVTALQVMIIQILRWLPRDERLELVLEQQDRYAGITNYSLQHVFSMDHELVLTSDGKPRLAKWSFVPKGSTILTDPADYFAFAMAHYARDPTSIKSQWTQPIIRSVDTVQAIGVVVDREKARFLIKAMLDGLKEMGITLPTGDEEFEKYRAIANTVFEAESMPSEFEKFDKTMRELMSVPHSEIKAKLDAEKAAKQKKRKVKKKPSALGRASGGKG